MRPDLVDSTKFGFAWGNTLVERVAHDDRLGWVLRVWGRHDDGHLGDFVDVRVTPSGHVVQVMP
jgi:hypothetical protein